MLSGIFLIDSYRESLNSYLKGYKLKIRKKKGIQKTKQKFNFCDYNATKMLERIKNLKKSDFCFCFNVILSLLGYIRVAHFNQINKTWISKLNFS